MTRKIRKKKKKEGEKCPDRAGGLVGSHSFNSHWDDHRAADDPGIGRLVWSGLVRACGPSAARTQINLRDDGNLSTRAPPTPTVVRLRRRHVRSQGFHAPFHTQHVTLQGLVSAERFRNSKRLRADKHSFAKEKEKNRRFQRRRRRRNASVDLSSDAPPPPPPQTLQNFNLMQNQPSRSQTSVPLPQ